MLLRDLDALGGRGQALLAVEHLLAEGVDEHLHGRARPHHERRVAAGVAGEVRLELLRGFQQAGEEDVAELVDVEQSGPLDAQLPDGRLDGGRAVLQEELAGLGGLAQTDQLRDGPSGGLGPPAQGAVRGELEHQHLGQLPHALVHFAPELLHARLGAGPSGNR